MLVSSEIAIEEQFMALSWGVDGLVGITHVQSHAICLISLLVDLQLRLNEVYECTRGERVGEDDRTVGL